MTKSVLAINPGSTSTKFGLFEDSDIIFSVTLDHEAKLLDEYPAIADQLPFRAEAIRKELETRSVNLNAIDAFVGRGGLSYPVEGGTYAINDLLVHDVSIGVSGQHASNLGAMIARGFADEYEAQAFIVNPVVVDELEDVARLTGLKEISRNSIVHALNQKEVAIQCARKLGKTYEESNFVVAHLGGGISISAHRKGRIIDTMNGLNGEGAMAATRSGALPAAGFLNLCFSGEYTRDEIYALITKNGGLVDHLGTGDLRKVKKMIDGGDDYALLVYRTLIYQIGKTIGAYAAVLCGKLDRIILTGGLANDAGLVKGVTEMVEFIAEVEVYPGELELEALAAGALRVLNGEEVAKVYCGKRP